MKALNAPGRLMASEADVVKLKLVTHSQERIEAPISTGQLLNPAVREICGLLQQNQRSILLNP